MDTTGRRGPAGDAVDILFSFGLSCSLDGTSLSLASDILFHIPSLKMKSPKNMRLAHNEHRTLSGSLASSSKPAAVVLVSLRATSLKRKYTFREQLLSFTWHSCKVRSTRKRPTQLESGPLSPRPVFLAMRKSSHDQWSDHDCEALPPPWIRRLIQSKLSICIIYLHKTFSPLHILFRLPALLYHTELEDSRAYCGTLYPKTGWDSPSA